MTPCTPKALSRDASQISSHKIPPPFRRVIPPFHPPATNPLAPVPPTSYPTSMTRRAMAMILLLVAVGTCASQGLSATLCRCTGHVFLGAAPESCCGACPEEESAAEPTLATAGHDFCLPGSADCFVRVSKGWVTYPPANGRDEAPAPASAEVEPFAVLVPQVPRHVSMGMSSWNLIHQPEPPGTSRVLLYRSLLI